MARKKAAKTKAAKPKKKVAKKLAKKKTAKRAPAKKTAKKKAAKKLAKKSTTRRPAKRVVKRASRRPVRQAEAVVVPEVEEFVVAFDDDAGGSEWATGPNSIELQRLLQPLLAPLLARVEDLSAQVSNMATHLGGLNALVTQMRATQVPSSPVSMPPRAAAVATPKPVPTAPAKTTVPASPPKQQRPSISATQPKPGRFTTMPSAAVAKSPPAAPKASVAQEARGGGIRGNLMNVISGLNRRGVIVAPLAMVREKLARDLGPEAAYDSSFDDSLQALASEGMIKLHFENDTTTEEELFGGIDDAVSGERYVYVGLPRRGLL